jgi:hypothetical protein
MLKKSISKQEFEKGKFNPLISGDRKLLFPHSQTNKK